MRRWKLAAGLLSSFGLLVIAAAASGPLTLESFAHSALAPDNGSESSAIDMNTVLVHVGALGRLEPQSEVRNVHAPAVMEPPRVHRMLVEEGQWVQEGDVLAMLDTEQRNQASLREARAMHRVAERTLERVLAGAKPAEIEAQRAAMELVATNLALAESQLRRSEVLLKSKAASTDSVDEQRAETESLRKEYQREASKLEAVREVREVDIRFAEAEVERSAAAVADAEAVLETSFIRSPICGRILRIHCRAGERIPDDGLLEMGDTSRMDVVAEVHEADAPRVQPGGQVEGRVVSSGEPLSGTVIRVGSLVGRKDVLSNDPVEDTDARVIEVRIRLDEASSRAVENLSNAKVEVRILRCLEGSRP